MWSSPLSIAVSSVLLPALTSAAPLARRDERGPVVTTDFPDPAIIKVDNTWYAFGTQSAFDYKDIKIQVATSTDFNSWSIVQGKDAVGKLPSWVNSTDPLVWAPDVIQRDDGSFLMYFSASVADNTKYHCVGTATSDSIEGPYNSNSDTPFACPTDQGGAIDASGFRDSDGTRYVLYKIDANANGDGGTCGNTEGTIQSTPIIIQQVQEDGVSKIGGAMQLITNGPDDGPLVEAPSMMKAEDGTYVLFFSSNCYETTNYDVAYATSNSPTSGFVKQPPLFVTGTNGLIGPGGASIATDGTHMAFHGYASQSDVGASRAMYVATISVSGGKVSF